MLLDANDILKIADFGGSLIKGSNTPSSVDYEVGSRLPGQIKPTRRSDIFALGSTIYEMIICKTPYKGKRDLEIQHLFKAGRFPEDIPYDSRTARGLRSVIERCWGKGDEFFVTVKEILVELENLGGPSRQGRSIGCIII